MGGECIGRHQLAASYKAFEDDGAASEAAPYTMTASNSHPIFPSVILYCCCGRDRSVGRSPPAWPCGRRGEKRKIDRMTHLASAYEKKSKFTRCHLISLPLGLFFLPCARLRSFILGSIQRSAEKLFSISASISGSNRTARPTCNSSGSLRK